MGSAVLPQWMKANVALPTKVDAEGRSWRSGAIVEQRSLKQWFLRITEYGDRLLDDLEKLTKWPEAIKRMQSSWIGRSKGSNVNFHVALNSKNIPLEVFTTRVDTIFGVSFVSVAPEAAVVDELLHFVPDTHRTSVSEYIARVKAMTKEDRTKGDTTEGVFTGLYARHPLNGKEVPLYLAEYVLPQYGTGVVMGVPAHDSRDYAFARHHGLSIEQVVVPKGEAVTSETADDEDLFTEHGVLQNSGEYSGLSSEEAMQAINDKLVSEGIGGPVTQFRLRDWLVSRQRYWGAPVPIIHCRSCGPVGVPTSDLPVRLPEVGADVSSDLRGGDGESPLARMAEWKNCSCPKCGGPAERDTDTLDTFVDSSWYFMRYCDARNDNEAFDVEKTKLWLKKTGVDLYIGGIEHAILHLLYSRFVTKFLYDKHFLATDEPFAQLLAQGMVLGKTYKSPSSKHPLKSSEYSMDAEGRVIETSSGLVVTPVWEKMSKSKYNGVNPEAIRSKHGADVTRLAVLFKAPPASDLEWEESDLAGQTRWLLRIWSLIDGAIAATGAPSPSSNVQEEQALRLEVHGAIKRVTEALNEHQSFNVAIAELMKLSNVLGERKSLSHSTIYHEALDALVKMLAPMAPHSSAEMFERLQQAGISSSDVNASAAVDVHACSWPTFDAELLAQAKVKVVLQVQGKPRDTILVDASEQSDRERVLALAMASPAVQRHLQGKQVRKAILIPPKKQGAHGLLNIVAA